jgi:hypothetical protein
MNVYESESKEENMAKGEQEQTVKFAYSEIKLEAIKVYMEEKKLDFDEEIVKMIDGMYQKHVPPQAKVFFDRKAKDIEAGGEIL